MSKQIANLVFLLAVSWVCTGTARAVEYRRILADKSNVAFVYKQMNVSMEGNFKHFTAQISFDPALPASAKAEVDIDLASIDTGALDADEEVRGKLWFNTKVYPQAHFVSSAVKAVGANRFDVSGKLTIKGKTLDVTAPMSLHEEGVNAVFEGVFVIKRADFGIGEGVWADFGTVANDVRVKFRLLATTTLAKK